MDLAGTALIFLRGLNVFYGVVFSYITGNFKFYNNDDNTVIFQMILTLLPINFFYNFLYYTDTLSTLLVTSYYYMNFSQTYSKKSLFIVRLFFNFLYRGNGCFSEAK